MMTSVTVRILSVKSEINKYLYLKFLIKLYLISQQVPLKSCDGGHYCSPPKECCKQGCCYLLAPSVSYRPPTLPTTSMLNPFFLGHWYIYVITLSICNSSWSFFKQVFLGGGYCNSRWYFMCLFFVAQTYSKKFVLWIIWT